jgi:AcrR family transcriptional regulator
MRTVSERKVEAAGRERQVAEIRRPTQERGRQKFDVILDAAEQFLQSRDPAEIGIYDIADALKTSPPSVYHFFPDISLVFVALAERYLDLFVSVPGQLAGTFESWQSLLDEHCSRTLKIFRENPAVRKVLLGVGYSQEIRKRDLASNRVISQHLVNSFNAHFHMPLIPDLHERFVEMTAINDAIWTLYLHEDGEITGKAEKIARRARISYLRTVLPEYLTPRTPDENDGS